jgi:hypothetical protein
MIIDLPHHLIDPPAIVAPEEVRRRRRRGSTNWDRPDRTTAPRPRVSIPTWLFIGAVLFDKNGRRCTVVHIDAARGLYYCAEDQ